MNYGNRGIDYGMGRTNIDHETGIRYGVIPHHEVLQAWCDSAESDYGAPTCPDCGNEVTESTDDKDYQCDHCHKTMWSDSCFGDTPICFLLDDGEYLAQQGGDDTDIFILRSPYYTRAQYCSPCAPGACYLLNPIDDGERVYCFGHDWFENGKAPYPVYSVETRKIVEPEE